MPQHLPGVLHSLKPTLNHLGYLAVVGLVLIEDFGVPVHIDAIYGTASRYSTYAAVALGVLLLAYIARRLVRISRDRPHTAS